MYISEQELFEACQVLFGGQLDISKEFLEYIQWSGVKSAYRKKVRETHPDRVVLEGEQVQRRMADEFISVQKAYENLTHYLAQRDNQSVLVSSRAPGGNRNRPPRRGHVRPTAERARHGSHRNSEGARPAGGFSSHRTRNKSGATGNRRPTTSSLYKGPLPRRRLLFGHFLYYSGLINWRTIVKALTWQRNNRPRIGELAKRIGWLEGIQVEEIVRKRKGMENFGQSAVGLRYLSQSQLDRLLLQQKRLQRRFGEYFIVHKIFSPEQVERFADYCRRHNGQFPEQ